MALKVLDVQPKDIHVVLEISLRELDLLCTALSNANIDYDSEADDNSKEAADFVTKKFFPFANSIVEDVKRHGS